MMRATFAWRMRRFPVCRANSSRVLRKALRSRTSAAASPVPEVIHRAFVEIWRADRGFGFLRLDRRTAAVGSSDSRIFVHRSVLRHGPAKGQDGVRGLFAGQCVEVALAAVDAAVATGENREKPPAAAAVTGEAGAPLPFLCPISGFPPGCQEDWNAALAGGDGKRRVLEGAPGAASAWAVPAAGPFILDESDFGFGAEYRVRELDYFDFDELCDIFADRDAVLHSPISPMTAERVAILDAGSQFGKVIDRRLRELRVETILMPLDTPPAKIRDDPSIKAVVISGGPTSVYAADAPAFDSSLFAELPETPILGICYGMQLLSKSFNGTVASTGSREDGQDEIACDIKCTLFKGMDAKQHVLLTHGDSVTDAGEHLEVVARSSGGIIAAVQRKAVPLHIGVQFHPEVDLTVRGVDMFRNFLSAAGCHFNFTMEDRQVTAVRYIRDRLKAAGDSTKVLCLVSGGVDSTVCAALLHEAIGTERVICVHVDHGFMRLDESAAVCKSLKEIGVELHVANAAKEFLDATTDINGKTTKRLGDSIAPEEKRKIIGDTFMRLMDKVTIDLGLDASSLLLAQGTLRPDLIESGSHLASKQAGTIKTHHNDTPLVRELRAQGRIIEPLMDYHKDEVRALGMALGLPEALVMRQPFPGPGLAIRVLCSDGPAGGEDDKGVEAKAVGLMAGSVKSTFFTEPLVADMKAAFPTGLAPSVLPVRCVGVQGDARTYAQALALCPQALPAAAAWPAIMRLATALPKELHTTNRIIMSLGPLPATAGVRSVTPTTLGVNVLDKLRAADDIVNKYIVEYKLLRKLAQVPVVLIPVVFDGSAEGATHSIVIRTFITNDFMTGVPATPGTDFMPLECLNAMVAGLTKLPWLSRVLYDLTAKPPGTTEWE